MIREYVTGPMRAWPGVCTVDTEDVTRYTYYPNWPDMTTRGSHPLTNGITLGWLIADGQWMLKKVYVDPDLEVMEGL